MPKTQDWLDIIEKASELKRGTKVPKGLNIYALTMLAAPPSRQQTAPPVMSLPPQSWNTGPGANGVVEPGKPVALDTRTNPPSVYHEGEPVSEFQGGRTIAPAGVVPAQTEQQQMGLARKQTGEQLPGYATGGTVYDDPNRPTAAYDLSNPRTQMYQGGQDQAFKTTLARATGSDPLMKNITTTSLRDYDTRAAVSDTEAKQQVAASAPYLTEGAKNAVVAKQRATYNAGLSDLTGSLARESMGRAEAANTELYGMGRTGVQDTIDQQTTEKTFGEQQYQSNVARSDQESSRMADDAQSMSYETWQARYPTATQADYDTAREYRIRQLASMDTANATASENLTQLKNSARWAEAESFLNAGDYANYAAIVKSVTGKDIDFQNFVEDRKYLTTTRAQTVTAGDLTNDAAMLGISADRLAAFVSAANSGADLAAANAASGLSLTQPQMDSIAARYKQTVESGDLALQATRNALGDDIYNSVQSMINKGSSLAAINAKLAEQGKPVMTNAEYSGMLDATPLGERNWGRRLSAANMLLTTPGVDNKLKAEAAYEEIFPGIGINFGEIVSGEKQEKFAEGLSLMAGYIASGLTYEQAYGLLASGGTAENMGVDASQLHNIYDSLNVNAWDEEWDVIEESKTYQDMLNSSDPIQRERAKNIRLLFEAKLTGEIDITTLHEYELTAPDGTVTTIYGKDQTEADKAAAKTPGTKVKDTGNVQYQMASTINVGGAGSTGVIPSKEGEGSDKPVGTTYFEGGRMYEVGPGGVISEVRVDPVVDAWGTSGDRVVAAGSEGNPYYQKIMDERVKSITDGVHSVVNSKLDPTTYAYMLNKTSEFDLSPEKVVADGDIRTVNFGAIPELNSVVNYGGALYKITSGVKSQKADVNKPHSGKYLDAVSLLDGRKLKIFATAKLSRDAAIADGLNPDQETSYANPWRDIKYMVPEIALDYSTQ